MTAHQFSNSVDRLMRLRRLKPEPRDVSIDIKANEIIRRICRSINIPIGSALSDSRKTHLVYARVIICHALRYELDMNLEQIAKKVGRNHSTVISNLRQFDVLQSTKDKQFMDLLEKSKNHD